MSKQSSVSLFELSDFRPYLQSWAKTRGRGEFRRISIALNMHTTLVSQILNSKKCFTEEQASQLCVYMGLNTLETDYFVKLIQYERAGSENLRKLYRRHLTQIQQQASEVKSRVPESKELSNQDRAIFYSTWRYSLIRLLTGIAQFQTTEEISIRLNLPVSKVQEILDFLVSRGLCAEENGKYKRTERNTHIEASSPLSIRHHQNWRAKSLQLLEQMNAEDLAFTAPVSLAQKDIQKVRSILLDTISEISKLVEKSSSEECVYLGIDWIRI